MFFTELKEKKMQFQNLGDGINRGLRGLIAKKGEFWHGLRVRWIRWIIRRKRKRIKRQIDNLQEESPFRTTEYGTSRQQVAKERTKMKFDQGQKFVTHGRIETELISFFKKAKFEKLASRNYFSQKCTFQLAAKESFHCSESIMGCKSCELNCTNTVFSRFLSKKNL